MWEKSKCVQNHNPEQTPICYIEWKLSHWAWWDDTTPQGGKEEENWKRVKSVYVVICFAAATCYSHKYPFLAAAPRLSVCLSVCSLVGMEGRRLSDRRLTKQSADHILVVRRSESWLVYLLRKLNGSSLFSGVVVVGACCGTVWQMWLIKFD